MKDSVTTELVPFWVHCNDCLNEWVLFYTPIPVEEMSKFKDNPCPKCRGKTFCGRINKFKVIEAV